MFVDPIRSAAEFQKTLNVLQSTSHATGDQMRQMSARAIQLGADVKLPSTSAKDAAGAMLELAKGGFSVQQSMAAARSVILLSTAAQVDNATAANLVSGAMGAFGLNSDKAAVQLARAKMVVDDFAGAANASTASMTDVGEALGFAGQTFKALGVGVGDASTAIAIMANNGIKGGTAGASLSVAFSRLASNAKPVTETLKSMGVSVFDNNGHFVGMREAIARLTPAISGMTDKQKLATLSQLGGQRGMRALQIVLAGGVEQWDKTHKAVTRAGQAQQLANAQTKGFSGAMSGLRSTVETLQIQFGLKLLPVLSRFVRWVTAELPGAVATLGSIISQIGSAIGQVVSIIRAHMDQIRAAFDGGIGAIRAFANFISDNVGNVRQLAIALGLGAAAFLVLTTAVKIYTAAQAIMNAVMLANPIGLVIVAITALVVGMTLLYQRSETARKIMDAAWAGIKAGAKAAMDFITNTVIPAAIAAWNRFGPQVVAVLNAAVSGIRTAVNAIATVVRFVVDQIEAHWRGVWKVFGPIVVTYLAVVKAYVTTYLNVIADVIRLFSDLLHGRWGAAWGELKNIVRDVLNGVKAIIVAILRGLVGTAQALAILIGTGIANGIKTAPGKLAGLAGDLAGKIASVASQAAGSAFSYMRQVGFSIADGVLSGIGNLGARIASAVGGAARSAASKSLIDILASSPSRLYADVVGKAIGEGVIVGVRDSLAKLGAYTGTTLRRISSELAPVASQLASDLAGVSGKAADAIIKKANEKLKPIADAFEKWAKNAKAKFDAGMAALITGVDAQFARAQAKIDAWKAKATPTEARLAAQQALAAYTAVQLAVGAANAALANLKTKQAQDWASLMATQRANMASLQASFNESRDSALLAGNTFQKGMGAAAGNPFAAGLIAAQAAFNATKLRFDQGLATQAEFIAAADALEGKKFAAQQAIDAASAASTEATEAQKLQATQAAQAQTLLDQYNTWQTSLAQETAAGASITTQKATDFAAQEALQQTFGADIATATTALNDALATQHTYALEQQAAREREAKDARAAELNAALVQRHNRILEHLNNVQHAWDLHFNELARMASASGTQLTNNIANALRNGQQTVAGAANAVANTIASYLRLKSPAEKGPMSNLDQWWSRLAPTLVRSLDDSMIKAHLTNAVTPNPTAQGNLGAPGPDNARYGFHTSKMEWYLERIHKVLKDNNKPGVKPAPVEVHVVGGIGVDASVYRSRR